MARKELFESWPELYNLTPGRLTASPYQKRNGINWEAMEYERRLMARNCVESREATLFRHPETGEICTEWEWRKRYLTMLDPEFDAFIEQFEQIN